MNDTGLTVIAEAAEGSDALSRLRVSTLPVVGVWCLWPQGRGGVVCGIVGDPQRAQGYKYELSSG